MNWLGGDDSVLVEAYFDLCDYLRNWGELIVNKNKFLQFFMIIINFSYALWFSAFSTSGHCGILSTERFRIQIAHKQT